MNFISLNRITKRAQIDVFLKENSFI